MGRLSNAPLRVLLKGCDSFMYCVCSADYVDVMYSEWSGHQADGRAVAGGSTTLSVAHYVVINSDFIKPISFMQILSKA